jgi:hypothetical protein
METPSLAEKVAAVKAHARANYNSDGWDILVECYEDDEIAREVANEPTIQAAISKIRWLMDEVNCRRADIQAERF